MPLRSADRVTGWAPRRETLTLLAVAALLLLSGLGATDLWAPDEPRYAEIAEEMRSLRYGASGWILPHVAQEAYTQKPPLYFWLAALAGLPGGYVSEFAARLPSALAGLACVALALALGRRLFPRTRAGFWAAALLLGTFRFAHQARRAQIDVVLCACTTSALLLFWSIECAPAAGARSLRWRIALLHGALGLAVLAKGPVGLLPLAVIAAYLLWQRRGREFWRLIPLWSPLLSLAPALVWLAGATTLAPSGFFEEAVTTNLLGRFFAGTAHPRPPWYYAYQLPLDFLPWTLLWPLAAGFVRRRLREVRAERGSGGDSVRFLLSWIGVLLVFFSISAGKRGLYLLPAYPALALLCGAALESALLQSRPSRLLRALSWALSAALASIGLAGTAIALADGITLPGAAGFTLPARFGWVAAAVCSAPLLGSFWLRHRDRSTTARTAVLVAGVLTLELAVFTGLYPALDSEKSPRPIAQAAMRLAAPAEPLAVYGQRTLAGGLAYYSGHPVVSLETPADACRFREAGGRILVLEPRRLAELRSRMPLRIAAGLRHGRRRQLVVLTPDAVGDAGETHCHTPAPKADSSARQGS